MFRMVQFEQRGRTASQRLFLLRQFSHAAPDCSLLLDGVMLVMSVINEAETRSCVADSYNLVTNLGKPEI
jgi:hypothetical protein